MAKLAGNTDLTMIDPEKLLDEAAVLLLKARANYLILLAQTTREEAIDLAKKYPDFDLVVCADGNAEPPNKAEEIVKNGTKLIEVGEKGMYAVVLGLYDDPQRPFIYQRVTLDSRFPPSQEMSALMSAYQDQLKDLGLKGLGIRPLDHPLKKFNGDFTGTDSCTKCHEESYKRLEEVCPLPRLCHVAKSQAAAGLRSGMHQLPRSGLESHEVLSLSRADTSARRRRPS